MLSVKQFETVIHVLAVPDMLENGTQATALGSAVIVRRHMETRLHGRHPDAGRHVPRRWQQPRLHPGELWLTYTTVDHPLTTDTSQ
jgi:hypothetical protein